MLRSRLHRFLLASVTVLGVIAFFMGRYIASWRPVELTEQEFKLLSLSSKHYTWYSADYHWAAIQVEQPEPKYWALQVWNSETKRSMLAPLPSWGPDTSITSVAFSKHLVATDVFACGEESCGDYGLIYNFQSHRSCELQIPSLKEHSGEMVNRLQFSPDATRLFIVTTHTLYICDAQTGRFLKKVRVGEGGGKAALIANGRIYIQFCNFKLSLWDVQQQHIIRRFSQLPSISAKDTEVDDMPFSPDGHIFYYHVRPKTSAHFYYFIDTLSGRVLWMGDAIPQFSPDEKECITVLRDAVEVRDSQTGQVICRLPKVPADDYWLSPDGNTLYSATSQYKKAKQQFWKQRAR